MNRTLYLKRKEAAKFRTTKPTKADQAAAKDTDINVIMRQYNVTGFVRGGTSPPQYADYTQLRDLKEAMDLHRDLRANHARLPDQLRSLTLTQLLALRPEEVQTILHPPEQPAKPPNTET